jgi:hypothetical protein
MKDKPFDKLISRLGLYNGLISQHQVHLDDTINSYEKNRRTDTGEIALPIFASRLVYRNPLTRKYEFAYDHFVDGNSLKENILKVSQLFCNLCISQTYEAFETYLKDIVAYSIFNKGSISPIDQRISLESFDSCRQSIERIKWKSRKNNKHLFALLYKLNPQIKTFEQENKLRFDFKEWYMVYSDVRHSIVHSNGVFDKGLAKGYSKFQKEILNKLFLGEASKNTNLITSADDADYIIKIVAQHGQLLNDLL